MLSNSLAITQAESRYRPNDPSWNTNALVEAEKTYCLYARKSSEDDERQALSIDSQINSMVAVAQRDGLNIVAVLRESKSAKSSGEREVFNELLDGIKQKRYNCILSWAPDRLSRNAWDLGSIVDMMDSWGLREIRTNGQTFKNSPNEKFLLMILCSQAKLENDNRSINVVRGLKNKAQMGHLPHVPPLGYLNARSYLRNGGRIVLDTERAPYIRKMFEKVAHEGYSWRALLEWIRSETPLKTRSGCDIVLSNVFKMLNTPFYYGMFEYPKNSGNWCKGAYDAIITKELFDEAQAQLNLSTRYRPRNKHFEFTKILKCGCCGSGITAEEKFKKIAGQAELKSYVYYHCSQYHDPRCPEPYIREDALILQFLEIIETIDVDMLEVSESLQEEITRYNLFQSQLLKKERHDVISPKSINIRDYLKYLICNGNREEKRSVLSMIRAELYIKDKQVLTKNPMLEIIPAKAGPKTKKSSKLPKPITIN